MRRRPVEFIPGNHLPERAAAGPEHRRSRAGIRGRTILSPMLALLPAVLLGNPDSEPRHGPVQSGISISSETRRAVQRGLVYLASTQNANGSWNDKVGRKVHFNYEGTITEHIGVTALAAMAFLANGNLPDQGPFAANVEKAKNFVLESIQVNGFISVHNSRMYSHAFAALFLSELYGMTRDPKLETALKMAVRLIISAQNSEGGWRYLPGAQDSDMSITVCQVMALRSARNAGIYVPKTTIDRAIEYVKKSFRPQPGAFTYQIEDDFRMGPSRISFALTACGVAALYGAGEYDSFEIEKGLEFMARHRPNPAHAMGKFDYYYGHYYAVQAAFQKGGRYWSQWYRSIQDELLALQERQGSWSDLVGKNYATAMAVIILQMPYQYLPITER